MESNLPLCGKCVYYDLNSKNGRGMERKRSEEIWRFHPSSECGDTVGRVEVGGDVFIPDLKCYDIIGGKSLTVDVRSVTDF